MRLPIQVASIIFRRLNNKTEFLILKRLPEKGSFWQMVTGGLEDSDKSLLECAYREIFEEAGIKKEDIVDSLSDVFQVEMDFNWPDPESDKTIKITEYFLSFEVKPETKITFENNIYPEHCEYKWVVLDEALSLLKWDNNKNAFRALANILENKK